jgi:SAM-dependent methyltransferase
MMDVNSSAFYDRDYFEGGRRQSPPHARERIYPLAARTASFLARRWAPARMLDLGCAKGYLVEALQAHGVRGAFGADISRYAVSHSEAAARGKLIVADVLKGIPVREGSCDMVTALDLFEHVKDPLPLLGEIRRVLAGHGVAYLKICHPRHPNAARDPSHVNVQPLRYWRRMFSLAGFDAERLYETDVAGSSGGWEAAKALVRRAREWAVIGTPADYKFILRKRAC